MRQSIKSQLSSISKGSLEPPDKGKYEDLIRINHLEKPNNLQGVVHLQQKDKEERMRQKQIRVKSRLVLPKFSEKKNQKGQFNTRSDYGDDGVKPQPKRTRNALLSNQTLHNIHSHDVSDALPVLVEPSKPKWTKDKMNSKSYNIHSIVVPNLRKRSAMPDDDYDLLSNEKPKSIDIGSKYVHSGQDHNDVYQNRAAWRPAAKDQERQRMVSMLSYAQNQPTLISSSYEGHI